MTCKDYNGRSDCMNDLRERAKKYLAKYQTPKAVIARKLGCSDSHFSHYLRGDRELGTKRKKILVQILEQ